MMRALIGLLLVLNAATCLAAEPTPWEIYLESPTPRNADRVTAISYSTGESDERAEGDLSLLAVQVQAAERHAARLALRLAGQSDGHQAEMLAIMLGRIIRVNPTLFLEELSAAQLPEIRLDGLVGNFGQEYVDRLQAQGYEAEQRIAALRSVRAPRLRSLRDACVKELQRSYSNDGG